MTTPQTSEMAPTSQRILLWIKKATKSRTTPVRITIRPRKGSPARDCWHGLDERCCKHHYDHPMPS
jgi:hypothetical protein